MEQKEQTERAGWWGSTLSKLKSALSRTKETMVDPIVDHQPELYNVQEDFPEEIAVMPPPAPPPPPPPREIDDDYLEELEEKLIKADLGLNTAETVVRDLRKQARAKGWNSNDVEEFLKAEFISILKAAPSSQLKLEPGKLNIILVVGVNGTGKTTSIGKLCWRLKQDGKRVLMAAGDTFRAAAESQLEIWSQRAGVDIVRLPDGADPGAVVFQAMQKAKTEEYDVIVIDTAGRLHNKANLMAELKKVRGVIDKHGAGLPLESLLVIDASTGQNGLQQAKVFMETCPLSGVILTKLDGSSKGGIVFSIAKDLKLPVKLIGLGEKIDELRDFEPDLFVEALSNFEFTGRRNRAGWSLITTSIVLGIRGATMEKKFTRKRKSNDARPSKPRANRMSSEDQQRFRDRGPSPEQEGSGEGGRSGVRRSERSERSERKYVDNVSLNLSPRMLQLAEELADESNMTLRQYLIEAIKYVLLAHGKRLGRDEKHLLEFVSENRKKVSTWKADSEKPAREGGVDEEEEETGSKPAYARGGERRGSWNRPDSAEGGEQGGEQGGERKRTWKPRSEGSESGEQGPPRKREWKPRTESGSAEGGQARRSNWKPRAGAESGGEQKRTWKPRAGAESGGEQKRTWKPRAEAESGGERKRTWKPRAEAESGGERKRTWKPRAEAESGGGEKRGPWKPRAGSESGAGEKRGPWKPRAGSASGSGEKRGPWKPRAGSASSSGEKRGPWKPRASSGPPRSGGAGKPRSKSGFGTKRPGQSKRFGKPGSSKSK